MFAKYISNSGSQYFGILDYLEIVPVVPEKYWVHCGGPAANSEPQAYWVTWNVFV